MLTEILDFIARRDQVDSPATLTRDFHVWPDYHGNRSPLADPTTCGMVSTSLLAATACRAGLRLQNLSLISRFTFRETATT